MRSPCGTVPVNVLEDTTDIDAGYFYDAAPIAVNDSYNAHLDKSVIGNVLTNDSDPDNDTLTATLATGPQNGTVLLNSNGSFLYTPSTGFSGQDSFTYTASDGYGGTSTATVTITVASTSAPTSASVNYTTSYTLDTTATDGVLAGASDPNGETLTAVLADGPANGTLILNPDGSFSYVADDGFVGTDSFSFYPTDADGPGNLTTVSIQVTDNPPVADPVTPTMNQDGSINLNLLAYDTDPDTGDALTLVGVSNGVYGTVSLNDDGTITYSPAAGWSDTDTFSYVISDSSGRLATSTITVTVNQLPGAPTVTQGSISTLQDNQVSIDLRTLVTSSQSSVDSLTYTLGSAANGTVSLSPDGYTVTFTPNAGYFGPANFGFLVTDPANGIKTASSVSVDVLPVAANVSDSANEDTSATLSLPNDTSPDGDTLTLLGVSDDANATITVNDDGTLTYASNAGWYGTDSFNYWMGDDYGDMVEGTVTVTVNAAPPTANPDTVTTQQGTPVSIDLSTLASDVNMPSANLTYSVNYPQNGTVYLALDGHTAEFSPDSGFAGETEFSYTVTDPTTGLNASSLVTVMVNGTISAPNASASVHAGNAVSVYPAYSGGSITSYTQPSHGTVELSMGGFLYTPSDSSYTGDDTFQYTVSDGNGNSATGTITITLTNSPPVANNSSYTTLPGQMVAIAPSVSDPDGDTLTITSVTQGTYGTVAITGSLGLSYTPNSSTFTGSDSFTYTVSDGHGGTATGTIYITVTSSAGSGGMGNSPPLAMSYMTPASPSPIIFSIQTLASDPNGYPLTIISVTPPMAGTVSIASDGQSVTYTGPYPLTSTDYFTYTVSDGHGGTATGTIGIYP